MIKVVFFLIYLQGVDLVPTDVIAGLILLSRQQERKRQQLRIYIPDEKETKGYSIVLVATQHASFTDLGSACFFTIPCSALFLLFFSLS
jgi:hypothetical protein